MSDTLTFRVELRFNPIDAAALRRQVDPEGSQDGEQGIYIVDDESVEPTFVNVVVSDEPPEAFRSGLQKVMDFDPFTGAIITLSHNQAGDFEATKPWARNDTDGQNLLDTDEGRAGWENLVDVPRDELFGIAASHAQHVALNEMLKRLTTESLADYDEDDELPDGTADFSA